MSGLTWTDGAGRSLRRCRSRNSRTGAAIAPMPAASRKVLPKNNKFRGAPSAGKAEDGE